MQKIVTNLWFDTEAEEAAKFYTSIFKNSKITNVSYFGEAGPREAGLVLTVDFELDGQRFTAINGGPEFKFSEAISLLINCETQEEIDEFWAKLLEGGGEESQCGWLRDKYGLSWQVTPKQLDELLTTGTPAQRDGVMREMLQMVKIDLKVLEDAHASA
jgi:predicted 3-demethylubiquinone-9 3-methyltransferase (glyoxalase superfamily)